jgi:hypothetical protein
MRLADPLYALALCAMLLALPSLAMAQTATRFTLQGELQDGGRPAHGPHDFEARLYLPGDITPSDVISLEDVPVIDGSFVLALEFPPSIFLAFTDAVAIELAVRPGASTNPHVVLGQRMSIEPTPVAQVAQHVTPGSVGADEIVPSQVQRRIAVGCSPNQAIRSVGEDGSVDCDADDSGISLSTGEGLTGGGSSGSVVIGVNFDVVQRRVQASCPTGQSIRAIAADGSVTCEIDDAGLGVAMQTASVNFFGGSGTTAQPQTTAQCPAGWRAIGGGFDTDCPATIIHRSQPSASAAGWYVQAVKPSTASCPNPSTLIAHAICVP